MVRETGQLRTEPGAQTMWQPDGWGFRARLGLLVPHADVGPESELHSMAPDGVSLHAARVPFGVMRAGGAMVPTIGPDAV